MLKIAGLEQLSPKGYIMRFVIAILAMLFTTTCFGGCPQLPEDVSARVAVQRTHLAGLSKRPKSIFAYADCAAEWSDTAVNSESVAPGIANETWRLVEDIANVLRRGAEKATNQESNSRYRVALAALGRSVTSALKEGGFSAIDKIKKRKFIFDYGSNLMTMGAPNAKEFLDSLNGLSQDLFGPEIIDQIAKAVDSCSEWDFVQGANRTNKDKQDAICIDDCNVYAHSVVGIFRPLPQLAAKPYLMRYERMLASCSSGTTGGDQ